MNKEKIIKQVTALKTVSQELWNDIDEHSKEEERVAVVLHNAESIMWISLIVHLKKGQL